MLPTSMVVLRSRIRSFAARLTPGSSHDSVPSPETATSWLCSVVVLAASLCSIETMAATEVATTTLTLLTPAASAPVSANMSFAPDLPRPPLKTKS